MVESLGDHAAARLSVGSNRQSSAQLSVRPSACLTPQSNIRPTPRQGQPYSGLFIKRGEDDYLRDSKNTLRATTWLILELQTSQSVQINQHDEI